MWLFLLGSMVLGNQQIYKAEINAILLSKFDTVDDKVGTALSLVYSTGKPIIYVGVGQKYPNLKELNVKTVVHSLLAWLDKTKLNLSKTIHPIILYI